MNPTSPSAMHWLPNADRRQRILAIALPIIGGMVSQNVLNLVDTAMVGSLGDAALAAAGLGSFTNYLAMAFILGLSSAVQAMAARRIGEGREHEAAVPLDGGLLLALVLGVAASLLFIGWAENLLAFLTTDPEVVSQGTPYLQWRLTAIAGVGMNFAFRGYWSATEQTRVYLGTLVVMHSLNIFLNWVLIFGHLGAPVMGVAGAGLATTLAIYAGTLIYFVLALIKARQAGFLRRIPSRQTLATMLRIGIPASTQQFFFAAGMVTMFWIIGRIGTQELAAANVLMNLVLAGLLPAMGFGLAAASLVGQALGRKEARDACFWGWQVSAMAAALGVMLGLPSAIFHKAILGVFIHQPATLQLAAVPMVMAGLLMAVDAVGTVLLNAHLGAGDSRRVMLFSVSVQWLLFLPAAFIVGKTLGYGLLGVWLAWAGYRLLQTSIMMIYWQRGKWAEVQL